MTPLEIESKIKSAKTYMQYCITQLDYLIDQNHGSLLVGELFERIKKVDDTYRQFLEELDIEDGNVPGTLYREGGVSQEFYIEAGNWHKISLLLREFESRNHGTESSNRE